MPRRKKTRIIQKKTANQMKHESMAREHALRRQELIRARWKKDNWAMAKNWIRVNLKRAKFSEQEKKEVYAFIHANRHLEPGVFHDIFVRKMLGIMQKWEKVERSS